jgi:outer membrane protein assembly factor BamA
MLALALVAAALATVPAEGEFVRSFRIEAGDAERLGAFVGLVPGRPLDPEAVRRAVELIFATGRFEDVQVDLVRRAGDAGVEVVFRPLPAPLLVAVRVEGDRVLSARAISRAARLRSGEPLWPQRLERAGRDVALALARRGHLEALVEPEARPVARGADAVFRVRAGPRVRVSAARVECAACADQGAAPALQELVAPRPGETYRKQKAEDAREAIRRRLVEAGFWRAEVELVETYDPARGRMAVVFRATPGHRTRLEWRGARLEARLVSEVRGIVRDGGASSDSREAGAERIEAWLRGEGHRDALARASLEPGGGSEAVVYEVRAGEAARVAAVELRGAPASLLSGLRTEPGRPLEDAALTEDARLVRSRLEELGHFEARVDYEVSDGGGVLPVVFVAEPGPRALVSEVHIDSPPPPHTTGDGGRQELALREAQPYRASDVARSRETLLSAWRRAGYLEARVTSDVKLSETRDAARVTLVVEPGQRTIVEHVVLAGLDHTRDVTVERELALQPGDTFSFERVLESQRRLLSLGIFERVRISELDPDRERRRDVVVGVQEAPRTGWSWGVGYSEQDRLRGSVEVTRRNLSGLGRTASVFARGSFRGSRFLLNLREPWLFGRKLDSFLTGFWEEEDRTSFDFNRKGGIVQAGRTLDARTSLILRYLYQDTLVYNVEGSLDELDRQYRTYTVSGPSASVVFDTRDDPLEPRRGVFLGADLQLSLDALGGESYLRSFFQATRISRLRTDLVFVLSGRVGLAATLAEEPPLLPLPERFFAGGDYGPRGFPVDGVGPQLVGTDGTLYPTGGNAVVLGGAEMRYNLSRSFQVASFLDTGNVYLETRDIQLTDLRWSAGLGLRYRTPIGPIRLDWGYVLDHQPGESRSRFHLTIGHAF